MTIKEFFSFKQNKFFWINLIAMVIVVALVLFGVLKGLDIYTRHGEAVVVPNVKGMGVAEAEKMFRNQGLTCIVSDSSYVKNLPAGCILEHNPAAGQKVKEGRTIYLTINTLSTPLLVVPDVADNSSMRQAQARSAGGRLQTVRERTHSRRKRLGIRLRNDPPRILRGREGSGTESHKCRDRYRDGERNLYQASPSIDKRGKSFHGNHRQCGKKHFAIEVPVGKSCI